MLQPEKEKNEVEENNVEIKDGKLEIIELTAEEQLLERANKILEKIDHLLNEFEIKFSTMPLGELSYGAHESIEGMKKYYENLQISRNDLKGALKEKYLKDYKNDYYKNLTDMLNNADEYIEQLESAIADFDRTHISSSEQIKQLQKSIETLKVENQKLHLGNNEQLKKINREVQEIKTEIGEIKSLINKMFLTFVQRLPQPESRKSPPQRQRSPSPPSNFLK